MRDRLVHLINPKTDSLTTRPLYLKRALYSPLAGLLAVAGVVPRDRYEVVLTDENIEPIDFDSQGGPGRHLRHDELREPRLRDRRRLPRAGVPVVMGGIHPSFMPKRRCGTATRWWSARRNW